MKTADLDEIKEQRRRKRARKRRYVVSPRNDLWRQAHGIPAEVGPVLLNHRRKETAAAREAKRPMPPRWLQRKRRLEAKAAEKERAEKARKSISARLGLNAA